MLRWRRKGGEGLGQGRTLRLWTARVFRAKGLGFLSLAQPNGLGSRRPRNPVQRPNGARSTHAGAV